jgi:hypothetical protein
LSGPRAPALTGIHAFHLFQLGALACSTRPGMPPLTRSPSIFFFSVSRGGSEKEFQRRRMSTTPEGGLPGRGPNSAQLSLLPRTSARALWALSAPTSGGRPALSHQGDRVQGGNLDGSSQATARRTRRRPHVGARSCGYPRIARFGLKCGPAGVPPFCLTL